ncbi:MAG: hypothetical protein QOJ81_191 [Chloroflexota bacterium]|nr:hypothetical protein [Chloroflexota bacterium]
MVAGEPGALADGFGVLGAVGPVVGAVGPVVAKIGVPVPLGADAHPPPITPMTIAKANERQRRLDCSVRICGPTIQPGAARGYGT